MERFGAVDHLLKETADPSLAENRFIDLGKDPQGAVNIKKLDEHNLGIFLKILGLSSCMYCHLRRYPSDIEKMTVTTEYRDREQFDNIEALCRYKYQQLLRVCYMDFASEGCLANYVPVLHHLSTLADKTIHVVEQLSQQKIKQKFPKLHYPLPVIIMALGKLGAYELNFSSDIDLVFISADAKIDTATEEHLHVLQVLTNHLIRELGFSNVDGFLYRVDTRLRPWGESAPPIASCTTVEEYFLKSARPWEKIAWLRARPIIDHAQQGVALLKTLSPLLYLRTLGQNDITQLAGIKADMSALHHRSNNLNVKTGEGGIRDIEFFSQILQLLHAANEPSLQTTQTLKILPVLAKLGLLKPDEASALTKSYLFMRRLENHLQMVNEQQTHQLPHMLNKRLPIARSMGFTSSNDDKENLAKFDATLLQHRAVAQDFFQRILP